MNKRNFKHTIIINIYFYANDSMGNLGHINITIIKDTTAPIISVKTPKEYAVFGSKTPSFEIEINDSTPIREKWYVFDCKSKVVNDSFHTTSLTIDKIIWKALPEGRVNIIFYAKDEVGNVGFIHFIIKKKNERIPSYDLGFLILGFILFSLISIVRIVRKKNSISLRNLNLSKSLYINFKAMTIKIITQKR